MRLFFNIKSILIISIFASTIKVSYSQSPPQDCSQAKEKYLKQNPDVAKAGMDPWEHFNTFGKNEGRKWPECENSKTISSEKINNIPENCTQARELYLLTNHDILKLGIDPWEHYNTLGKNEGRKWPECDKISTNLPISEIVKIFFPGIKMEGKDAWAMYEYITFLEPYKETKNWRLNEHYKAIVTYYKDFGIFPNHKNIEKVKSKLHDLNYQNNGSNPNELNWFYKDIEFQKKNVELNKYDFESYLFVRLGNIVEGLYEKQNINKINNDKINNLLYDYNKLYLDFYSLFGSKNVKDAFLNDYYHEVFCTGLTKQIYYYRNTGRKSEILKQILNTTAKFSGNLKPNFIKNASNKWVLENEELFLELSKLYLENGLYNECYSLLKNIVDSQYIIDNLVSINSYLINSFDCSVYQKSNINYFSPTVFEDVSRFSYKNIDFSKNTGLVPITNLSSQINYSKVNFLPVNDISVSFNLFLTKGNKNGRLWPLFSALTVENTNNLFEILKNEKDIVLLIENNYIPNIVHIENINDFTKVYFIANQEKNILGVFDMPKFAEGFKKIPVNYYFFETIFKSNVDDLSLYKKGEVLEDISYKKLDENSIQQNKLQETINCDKLYNYKIEIEKSSQLELEKTRKLEELKKQRQEEERIKISQEQNLIKSESKPAQNNLCNLKFVDPILKITYTDNRIKCCCCNANYARYKLDNEVIQTKKIEYLVLELAYHANDNNFDAEHMTNDTQRLSAFVSKNYNALSAIAIPSTVIMYYKLISLGAIPRPSKNVKANKYINESKYCSQRCENDYRCNCK